MPLVRTTINPGEVIHVSDTELVDLERMGLIHSKLRGPLTPAEALTETVRLMSTADQPNVPHTGL